MNSSFHLLKDQVGPSAFVPAIPRGLKLNSRRVGLRGPAETAEVSSLSLAVHWCLKHLGNKNLLLLPRLLHLPYNCFFNLHLFSKLLFKKTQKTMGMEEGTQSTAEGGEKLDL